MRKTTLRLSDQDELLINQIQVAQECSLIEAIRFALQVAAEQQSTESTTDDVDWKRLYLDEKKRSDQLVDKLATLTDKVTDSLQASQMMQAMDKPLLMSQEHKKQSFWQRFSSRK